MEAAPRLRHANGMVLVEIDGRSVVFPSEADARFYFEAYTDVPTLEAQNAALRQMVDEAEVLQTQQQVHDLTAQVAKLAVERDALRARLNGQIEATARARQTARLLTGALRKKLSHAR